MPFKIVRNDIAKMDTEAIVNTANDHATVGTGCDSAIYKAVGYEKLLDYRKEKTVSSRRGKCSLLSVLNCRPGTSFMW